MPKVAVDEVTFWIIIIVDLILKICKLVGADPISDEVCSYSNAINKAENQFLNNHS